LFFFPFIPVASFREVSAGSVLKPQLPSASTAVFPQFLSFVLVFTVNTSPLDIELAHPSCVGWYLDEGDASTYLNCSPPFSIDSPTMRFSTLGFFPFAPSGHRAYQTLGGFLDPLEALRQGEGIWTPRRFRASSVLPFLRFSPQNCLHDSLFDPIVVPSVTFLTRGPFYPPTVSLNFGSEFRPERICPSFLRPSEITAAFKFQARFSSARARRRFSLLSVSLIGMQTLKGWSLSSSSLSSLSACPFAIVEHFLTHPPSPAGRVPPSQGPPSALSKLPLHVQVAKPTFLLLFLSSLTSRSCSRVILVGSFHSLANPKFPRRSRSPIGWTLWGLGRIADFLPSTCSESPEFPHPYLVVTNSPPRPHCLLFFECV